MVIIWSAKACLPFLQNDKEPTPITVPLFCLIIQMSVVLIRDIMNRLPYDYFCPYI